ncbi:hypothetical protein L3Q82_008354 [Scortum barcoo]|uniref:Uncharacterized protein n=1 Tax=Scortum barcoo TaxID=214431 RepID=A0ACB8WHI8_9TELE|nr:hypothetical protein L3Q82_008354 [Scortum barcoo]
MMEQLRPAPSLPVKLLQRPSRSTEGEFVKTCMLKAAAPVCPEKRQAFANISLSRNTVAERIGELARDLNSQLKDKVKSFIAFSIAIDESTNVTDVAQLSMFICGVDASLTVTEEFVALVPMLDTTTGNDLFESLFGILDQLEVDWSRAVSVATDNAPSMIGKKAGVVSKSLKMDHVMRVVIQTVNFIRAKGLPLGRNKLITEYYDSIRAFQMKLALWETQLSQHNPVHFLCLKSQTVDHESVDTYKNMLSGLFTPRATDQYRSFSLQHSDPGQADTEAPQPGTALIRDFLTNRPQVVRIGDNTSCILVLSTGKPQGCVLSPAHLHSLHQ